MNEPIPLFVDTSALYAYVNRADRHHASVQEILDRPNVRIVITDYVFDELITLVARRMGHAKSVVVGEQLLLAGDVELVPVAGAVFESAWLLYRNRADKGYSFTDCTSFALIRSRPHLQAVSLDRHFRQEGIALVGP